MQLSNGKRFEEMLEDIVGLYLSPPEHAIVLSCDEKSQIQALDRAQSRLPIKKERCQTMTHDYASNGTTSLFAVASIAEGAIIAQCMNKRRHQEWLSLFRLLAKRTPQDREVHVICENYATHKHESSRLLGVLGDVGNKNRDGSATLAAERTAALFSRTIV